MKLFARIVLLWAAITGTWVTGCLAYETFAHVRLNGPGVMVGAVISVVLVTVLSYIVE